MAESDLESGAEPDPPATVPPGAMSALLRELAAAPATDVPPAWNRALVPGSVVGRFELLRELGRGGFGVVYEARDHTLGRLVAFKAVRPGSRVADHQRGQWLWKEAEAAAQLSHPNIVTLFDVGTSEHGPYLVFELLHGETLEDRLRHGPVPWRTALSIGVHVARALAHAHAAGVVHRDLKPANVFLTENDGVKVLDFGLAHVFGTSALGGGGTPAFMAPEQWRGRAEDARTDVFGLGAILYAALTGRAPYEVRQSRSTVLDSASLRPSRFTAARARSATWCSARSRTILTTGRGTAATSSTSSSRSRSLSRHRSPACAGWLSRPRRCSSPLSQGSSSRSVRSWVPRSRCRTSSPSRTS